MGLPKGSMFANRYRIVRGLGTGGMGEVYLVEDLRQDGKRVALKVIANLSAINDTWVARFRREISHASRLVHENIVAIYDYGATDNGQPYYTMEYIKGETLGERLGRGDVPDFAEVCHLLYAIACALDAVHRQGVVHRDVKPDNVVVGKAGEVKLMDFGIAKAVEERDQLTHTGQGIGTKYYMAPEQFRKGAADPRTDIYAFGIVAYELASGKRPYNGEYAEVYTKHLLEPLPPLCGASAKIPKWYQQMVTKCAAKSKGDRYQQISEVGHLLQEQLWNQGVQVPRVFEARSGSGGNWNRLRAKAVRGARNLYLALVPTLIYFLCSLWVGSPVQQVNYWAMDQWFRRSEPAASQDDVRVIAVDDESYAKLGVSKREVMPRRYHAKLLRRLKDLKVKAVVFDYVFDEWTGDEEDQLLEKSLSLAPTYLAKMPVSDAKGTPTGQWTAPHERFMSGAKGAFSIQVRTLNGKVRQFPMTAFRQQYVTPLTAVLDVGNSQRLPMGPDERDYIRFRGSQGVIVTHSLSAVLAGESAVLEDLRGKYVIVGYVAPDLFSDVESVDTFSTPMSQKMPGVEVHATILSNLLHRDWIEGIGVQWERWLGLVLAYFLTFVVLDTGVWAGGLVAGVSMVALPTIQWLGLGFGLYLPVTAVVAAAILALGLAASVEYYETKRKLQGKR